MGTEESQGAKGVDIGQDMVPLFPNTWAARLRRDGSSSTTRTVRGRMVLVRSNSAAPAKRLGSCAMKELADCSAQKFAPIAFKLS